MWPFKKRKRLPHWKGALLSAGAAFLVLFLLAVSARLISGDEDTWLCVNGAWVKHGNPSGQPTGQCGQVAAAETKKVKPQDGNSIPVSNHKIKITDSGIDPAELTISVNNSVTWQNVGSSSNSIIPLSDVSPLGLPPLWAKQSPPIGPGGTFTIGFPRAGIFKYRCSDGSSFTGEIIIE
jgi:plastocyanin